MDSLTFSLGHTGIYSSGNLWEEFLFQEAVLPSSKEEKRCKQRWKEEERGEKGQSMNLPQETKLLWRLYETQNRNPLWYFTSLDQGV